MNIFQLPKSFAKETDPRISILKKRLEEFYAKENYPAFHGSNNQPNFWWPIRQIIAKRLAEIPDEKLKLLELGAGCTNFGTFLADLRGKIDFHVQDITDRNVPYLQSQSDHIHIGPITIVEDKFDVIFATFVWEHMTEPRKHLDYLLSILKPGGSLVLAAPRYDFPFYLSPSCRHLPKLQQLMIGLWLSWKRLLTFLFSTPQFLIHTEPAALHVPWFRDADAVHWVSLWDLKSHLKGRYQLRHIKMFLKGYHGQFWENFLLLFVEIKKTDDNR